MEPQKCKHLLIIGECLPELMARLKLIHFTQFVSSYITNKRVKILLTIYK